MSQIRLRSVLKILHDNGEDFMFMWDGVKYMNVGSHIYADDQLLTDI